MDLSAARRAPSRPRPVGPTPAGPTYRPELQGLRAVAVALVVAYHVWFGRVSGGVDVFLVLSGFLLTGQLVRAGSAGRALDLRRRWSRTLVRLLPSMVVVLLATTVAAALVLPEWRWPQVLREVLSSLLFVENWRLAADSVDYAAQHVDASPTQHFWSLAIQGQFFLIWPVLLAGVVALGTAAGVRARVGLTCAVVTVASLAYSVSLTAANQPLAYFHSWTRAWELALGGLLACVIGAVPLALRTRLVLGWAGVLGLVACGLLLRVDDVFPGWAALWPTGCAVAVLLAGSTGSPRGVDRWLAHPLAQRLGALGFTLYLWHWPVLIITLVATEQRELGLVDGLAVVVISVVLAAATHHLVEQPLAGRGFSTRGGVRLGLAGVVVVLAATATWQSAALARTEGLGEVGDAAHPGAVALLTGPPEPAALLPAAVALTSDWVGIDSPYCERRTVRDVVLCTTATPEEPTRRIAVVGDSHARQLGGALVPLAARHGWEITWAIKDACPLSTSSEVFPGEPTCLALNAALPDALAESGVDTVVVMGSRNARVGLTEVTPTGFAEQWTALTERGLGVVALRDSPRFEYSVPTCLDEQGRGAPQCEAPRDAVYTAAPPWTGRDDVPASVAFVDTADLFCPGASCVTELGNVAVYLDDNHLTSTFSHTLADPLEARLLDALGTVAGR
ncbi:acyltransferase family protein [Rhodococcus aerolatus]